MAGIWRGPTPIRSALMTGRPGGSARLLPGQPRPPIIEFQVDGISSSLSAGSSWVVGGAATLTAPMPSVRGVARSTPNEDALVTTAPAPTLHAFAGANASASIPYPTTDAAGTVVSVGKGAMGAPAATASASGSVAALGNATMTFGSLLGTYRLVGYSGAVLSVTVGAATTVSSASSGSAGTTVLTLPLFELVAAGTVRGVSSAELLAPAPKIGATAQAWIAVPGATLRAIGTAVVAVSYEAYCVNLKHMPYPGVVPTDEVTRYTNYPFDRIVRFKNSYFGVAADGLYLLEGTTDSGGAPIQWAFKTGVTDFGDPHKKTVESVYFSGRLGAATVQAYVGEGAAQSYAYPKPPGNETRNYRQQLGRGLKSRYYSFGAAGTGVMELDSIDFSIGTLTRRI